MYKKQTQGTIRKKIIQIKNKIEKRLHTTQRRNYMNKNDTKKGTIQETKKNYTREDYIKKRLHYIKRELYRKETI